MNTQAIKHTLKLDALMFGVIMLLALVGVGITEGNPSNAHQYWRVLLVAMAVLTTVWGIWRNRKQGLINNSQFVFRQAMLWGATLAGMLVIYLLQAKGRMNYEITGLMVLLLLALATFIDGLLVSWKLYPIGGLLLLSLLLAAYVEIFLWDIVFAAFVLVAIVIAIVIWKMRSQH